MLYFENNAIRHLGNVNSYLLHQFDFGIICIDGDLAMQLLVVAWTSSGLCLIILSNIKFSSILVDSRLV